MSKKHKLQVMLAKLQSAQGTGATPTGSDAILSQMFDPNPAEAETKSRDLVRPYFGASEEVQVSQHSKFGAKVEFAGAGTAGTAPLWGKLMRSCAAAETLLASSTGNTIAATATASGTPTGTFTFTRTTAFAGYYDRTVTLTCTTGGASGTAAFTVSAPAIAGMDAYSQTGVVMTNSAPFALPNGAVITPTVGTSFVSGDVYTIALTAPYARYTPASTALEWLTIWHYIDGIAHKSIDAQGTATLTLDARDIPAIKFDFTALYSAPTDESNPAATFTGWQKPLAVNVTNTRLCTLFGHSCVMSKFTMTLGNTVQYLNLVNQEGVDTVDRKSTFAITIEAPSIAVRDFFSDAKNITSGVLNIVHGLSSGNVVQVYGGNVSVSKPKYSEENGIVMLSLDGTFNPSSSGNDEWAIYAR